MKLRGGTELGGGIIQVFSRGGGTLGLKVWGTGILVPGPYIYINFHLLKLQSNAVVYLLIY